MEILKTEEQGVVILSPDGSLDSNSAPVLEQEIGLINAGDNGQHLLLYFSKVEYISSAGLRVVLKTVKERQAASKSFAVSNMQDHVREVFLFLGVVAVQMTQGVVQRRCLDQVHRKVGQPGVVHLLRGHRKRFAILVYEIKARHVGWDLFEDLLDRQLAPLDRHGLPQAVERSCCLRVGKVSAHQLEEGVPGRSLAVPGLGADRPQHLALPHVAHLDVGHHRPIRVEQHTPRVRAAPLGPNEES